MRRSLFVRLLGLSLAVAVFAIAATAWLTTRETSERFRGEFERTLEADSFLYQQLTSYATAHETWDGVEQMVIELAERTGRRVALTGLDGDVIADSAALSGGDAPSLPSEATAEIDAASPDGAGIGTAYVGVDGMQATGVVAEAPMTGTDVLSPFWEPASPTVQIASTISGHYLSPTWRMSDEELRRRTELVSDAEECVREALGTDEDVVVSISGDVLTVSDHSTVLGLAEESESVHRLEGRAAETSDAVAEPCIPDVLRQPSDAARELNDSYARMVTECLDDHGVEYSMIPNEYGLRVVAPEFTGDAADGAAAEVPGADCLTSAWENAMADFVAAPALLYTGGEDRFAPLVSDGLGRTLAAGGAVLAVVTGVTVLGGRRLTRPIRALTDAARRMGDGEQGVRVHTSGRDEVAQLAGAFNSMAASIEADEAQRRAMISDVAHELRTPLSNVQGYLEAAEDGVVPLDPELVRSLLEESFLLRRLIDDLQDLALADAGMLRFYPESREVSEVAHQVVASHRAAAEEAGVMLALGEQDDGGSSLTAWVDPERLRQALSNLVGNAVRFTPDGGEVTVTVRRDDESVILAVADTGAGIAAEHIPRLFDRFYRVEESRSRATGGSGLGLAITKHLIEAQGGSVGVESTEGVGSTFRVTLPLHRTAETG